VRLSACPASEAEFTRRGHTPSAQVGTSQSVLAFEDEALQGRAGLGAQPQGRSPQLTRTIHRSTAGGRTGASPNRANPNAPTTATRNPAPQPHPARSRVRSRPHHPTAARRSSPDHIPAVASSPTRCRAVVNSRNAAPPPTSSASVADWRPAAKASASRSTNRHLDHPKPEPGPSPRHQRPPPLRSATTSRATAPPPPCNIAHFNAMDPSRCPSPGRQPPASPARAPPRRRPPTRPG